MFVNRIEIRFGYEINPHISIRSRAPFKSPVCRFVRLNFMNRVISRPDVFERIWRNLREPSFVLFLTVCCDELSYQTSYVERINHGKRDSKITADATVTLTATNRLWSPAMRNSCPVTARGTMFGSTVTTMVADTLFKTRIDEITNNFKPCCSCQSSGIG